MHAYNDYAVPHVFIKLLEQNTRGTVAVLMLITTALISINIMIHKNNHFKKEQQRK